MKGWIFQGNPTKFQVDQYLLLKNEILWLVRPEGYAKRIEPGDIASIWCSDGLKKGTGGIIASGEVLDTPTIREDDAPDLWISPITTPRALRVRIRILDRRLSQASGMLLRTVLKEHPSLKELWVLKWHSQTVFPVSGTQIRDLISMWESSRAD
jgi:hypothetical protein